MCSHATVTDSDLLSFIWDSNLGLILAWMFNTSELDELFRILNSIKGFKLRQPQWSNTTQHRPLCMKSDEKCKKPNQECWPDIVVILEESQQHPFPIPILTCEIIGKKEIWGGTGATEYKGCVAMLTSFHFCLLHTIWKFSPGKQSY